MYEVSAEITRPISSPIEPVSSITSETFLDLQSRATGGENNISSGNTFEGPVVPCADSFSLPLYIPGTHVRTAKSSPRLQSPPVPCMFFEIASPTSYGTHKPTGPETSKVTCAVTMIGSMEGGHEIVALVLIVKLFASFFKLD